MPIDGMAELMKKLADLGVNVTQAMGDAGKAALEQTVQVDAISMCPVDTGHMQSKIHTELEVTQKGFVATCGINGEDCDYAGFVEYGTSRMSAQPFMRPALDQNMTRIPEVMIEQLTAAVEKVKKG